MSKWKRCILLLLALPLKRSDSITVMAQETKTIAGRTGCSSDSGGCHHDGYAETCTGCNGKEVISIRPGVDTPPCHRPPKTGCRNRHTVIIEQIKYQIVAGAKVSALQKIADGKPIRNLYSVRFHGKTRYKLFIQRH